MIYLVNNNGSINAIRFHIKGVEYHLTGSETSESKIVWDTIDTIKRIDTKEKRFFFRHELKNWIVTPIKTQ